MSTNYYYYRPFKEPIHIGLSSAGWCFQLHITDKIRSLDDWKKEFEKTFSYIKDEYGDLVSKAKMLDIITNRSWPQKRELCGPYSCFGPNNLLRSVIDDRCIAHGEGTWDLIEGEFE